MKIAGYYNEHGLPYGFLRIVLSNPPNDNNLYLVSRNAPNEYVEIDPSKITEEYLAESEDILYSNQHSAYLFNNDPICEPIDELVSSINSRINELDDYPVMKFNTLDGIYYNEFYFKFPILKVVFKNAKNAIKTNFGADAAEKWQNHQIFKPKILKAIGSKNSASIETIKIVRDGSVEYLDIQYSTNSGPINRIEEKISGVISRYRDDLLIRIRFQSTKTLFYSDKPPRNAQMSPPKVFISYSWTTNEHTDRVLRLASDLRVSGVDCILDRWHLKEGHDPYAFMEQMVADETIEKVVIIGDKGYAEKANNRSGGVGTETQIITPEIYAKKDQSKFGLVLFERDEEGEPYLPTFYKNRIYIDMSDQTREAEGFERLVRWIFDKPFDMPPPIGKAPDYLNETADIQSSKTSQARNRVIDALRNGKSYAVPATKEYFDTVLSSLEDYRANTDASPIDDEIVRSIDRLRPLRDEVLSVVSANLIYGANDAFLEILKSFIEGAYEYTQKPEDVRVFRELDWDNYRFFLHEVLLHVVALGIKNKKFSWTGQLITETYFLKSGRDIHKKLRNIEAFRFFLRSIDEVRNNRLNLNRLSLHADFLKERCTGSIVTFEELLQADFSLFLSTAVRHGETYWYPITGPFMDYSVSFELYARATSQRNLSDLLKVMSLQDLDSLHKSVDWFYAEKGRRPRGDFGELDILELGNIRGLGSQP